MQGLGSERQEAGSAMQEAGLGDQREAMVRVPPMWLLLQSGPRAYGNLEAGEVHRRSPSSYRR